MGKENRESLDDSRAINVQLQEQNKHLRKKVQMYDQRMEEMEKKLETFAKLLSFLKKWFDEFQDSLTTIMAYWDKIILQVVQLGEKVVQVDSGQEDRLTQMMV